MKKTGYLANIFIAILLSAPVGALAGEHHGMGPDDGPKGAEPGPGRHGPDMLHGPEKMAEKLGLNQTQIAKLKEIHQKFVDQLKSRREDLNTAHEKMHEGLTGSAMSDKELIELNQKIKKMQDEVADLHFKVMLETRAILTPEQRAKFADLTEKGMKMNGKSHRGHGPDCDAPPPPMPPEETPAVKPAATTSPTTTTGK